MDRCCGCCVAVSYKTSVDGGTVTDFIIGSIVIYLFFKKRKRKEEKRKKVGRGGD
jgi:hypothetical protein